MEIKFLDLAKEYHQLKPEIDLALEEIFQSSSFINGKQVSDFEAHFADFLEVGGCIGVGNGTDALEIAIKALDLPKNSEIILPANSFIASLEAVINNGYKAVLVDCGEDFLIDDECIKKALSPKTSGIMPVHLYGRACNMEKILKIAKQNNLKIIEDCSQAHGAKSTINGSYKNVGSIGDVGCFSFYPGKNLGAYGDGGAISSNDTALLQKCKIIANHGNDKEKYHHTLLGRNSRLDSIQAAIIDIKLKYLSQSNKHRQKISELYTKKLSSIPHITTPPPSSYKDHCVWHLYTIILDDNFYKRDELKQYLQDLAISTGIHYPQALSEIEAVTQNQDCILCPTPNAQKYSKNTLSLPIGNHIQEKEVDYICGVIEDFIKPA